MKPGKLIRLACYYAEQDRLGYLDSIANCKDPEMLSVIEETKSFIKELHKYKEKRWGKPKKLNS